MTLTLADPMAEYGALVRPRTRDEARSYFKGAGLTYEDVLTPDCLAELRRRLDQELRSSGLIQGTYRAKRAASLRRKGGLSADIRCSAYYFEGRQAISFEPSGFIGFAGWADDENIQPVLAAFIAWVDLCTARKALASRSAA